MTTWGGELWDNCIPFRSVRWSTRSMIVLQDVVVLGAKSMLEQDVFHSGVGDYF